MAYGYGYGGFAPYVSVGERPKQGDQHVLG